MTTTENQIIPFDEWIKALNGGAVNAELTLMLPSVVEAVSILRKRGSVTIVIGVDPAGDTGQNVAVAAKVTANPPKPAPTPSIYFVGDHGTLHRDDPYQQRLDIDLPLGIDAESGEVITPQEKP